LFTPQPGIFALLSDGTFGCLQIHKYISGLVNPKVIYTYLKNISLIFQYSQLFLRMRLKLP
jgi:hypothetical protein